MEEVVRDKMARPAGARGQLNGNFDLIVHSTGGLVARRWISMYYRDRSCPVRNLVTLAPANFGSQLARDVDDRGAGGMRSHHHPGQDVADQQRLPQALCQELSQQSGDHNENNVSGYTQKRRLSHAPANWVARADEWTGGGTGTFGPLGEQQT